MTILEKEVSKILQPHFEAYQLQSDEGENNNNNTVGNSSSATPYKKKKQKQQKRCTLSVESRVTQIKNQISSFASSLNESNDDTIDDNNLVLDEAIASILIQYVDAAVGTEISGGSTNNSEIQESIDKVLELAAAFASAYSDIVCQAMVSRAVQYSTTILERIRAHACSLLGHLAYHLKEPVTVVAAAITPNKNMQSSKKKASNKSKTKEDEKKDDSCYWLEESNHNVREALIPRLTDKSMSVRYAAIQACGNVFHPHHHRSGLYDDNIDGSYGYLNESNKSDNKHDLLQALLWNLSHDPSISSRIAALHNVPILPETVDHVISRIRESKSKVRIEALEVLREKTNVVTDLSENQRVQIIRYGLTDRCLKTKEATSKLCVGWMKTVKFDPIALLKLIDIINNEEECVKVINVILEAERSNDSFLLQEFSDPEIRAYGSTVRAASKQMIQFDEIESSMEQILFSRVVCSSAIESAKNNVISSSDKETIIGKILPEVPLLCDMFEKQSIRLMDSIQTGDASDEEMQIFMCSQILQFFKVADLNEEGSRRHFASVMKRMLSSLETPDELLEGCIHALRLVHDNEVDIIKTISEIIDDVTAKSEEELEHSPAKNTEDVQMLRTLSILSILLETTTVNISTCELVMDYRKYIVPSVVHANPLIREAGISCFGKLGLFTSEQKVCSEYKALLLEVASRENEKDEIRAQAVLSLSDWTMVFSDILKPCAVGIDNERSDENDDNCSQIISFADIISDLLDHARPGVVAIAAEVAAKLLFSGKICNSSWIAKLLLIYFDSRMTSNESYDDDVQEVGNLVRLQQMLSLFFPAYSVKHEPGRDALVESISMFLEMLYTKTSHKVGKKTKASWPAVKMIDYVCSIVDMARRDTTGGNNEAEDGNNSKPIMEEEEEREKNGDDIASLHAGSVASTGTVKSSTKLLVSLQVAEFLKENSSINTTTLRSLCKYLGNLDLDIESEGYENLVSLKRSMEQLGMFITDSTCLRSLTKLNDILVDIEEDDEEEEEEEDEEEESIDEGIISDEETSSVEENIHDDGVDDDDDDCKENLGGNRTTKKKRGPTVNGKIKTLDARSENGVKRKSPRNITNDYAEFF